MFAAPVVDERITLHPVRQTQHLPQGRLRLPIEALAEQAQQLVEVAAMPGTFAV
jgi:hypothetical protein